LSFSLTPHINFSRLHVPTLYFYPLHFFLSSTPTLLMGTPKEKYKGTDTLSTQCLLVGGAYLVSG
jgi:hypothetical protein